jgi:hypothetical protein
MNDVRKREPMKTDRPLFLKFRNDNGEVQVCLMAAEHMPAVVEAGFSCCNPKDMHLVRGKRVFKHRSAAEGRMKKKPVTIRLPQPLEAVPKDEQYDFVRSAVVEFMKDFKEHNLGLRRYTGSPEKCEFHQWFSSFYAELTSSD